MVACIFVSIHFSDFVPTMSNCTVTKQEEEFTYIINNYLRWEFISFFTVLKVYIQVMNSESYMKS